MSPRNAATGTEAAELKCEIEREEKHHWTGRIWDLGFGFGVWVWVGLKEARRTSQETKPQDRRQGEDINKRRLKKKGK